MYLSFSPTFPPLLSLSLLSRAGDEPSLQQCFIHNDTWPIWKSNNTVCAQYPGHSITRVVVVKKQQLSYSYSINNTTAQKHKQIPKCKHVHLPFVTQHSKMQYTSLLSYIYLSPRRETWAEWCYCINIGKVKTRVMWRTTRDRLERAAHVLNAKLV